MEIETKALITKEQFADLITSYADKLTYSAKNDTYYSKYSSFEEKQAHNEPIIRIRTGKNFNRLTVKVRHVNNDVEQNDEVESEFENIDVVKRLLDNAGYKPYFVKSKKCWGFTEVLKDNSRRDSSLPENVEDMSDIDWFAGSKITALIDIEQVNDLFAVELEVIFSDSIFENIKSIPNTDVDIDSLIEKKRLEISSRIKDWFDKHGFTNQIDNRPWISILKE